MDERARKIAANETLFREVNERVHELDAGFRLATPFEIVCECGDASCFERISIDREGYERVRSDARTFAVVPGHEEEDVERVIDEHAGYVVVRKRRDRGGDLAAARDPRSPSAERQEPRGD